MGRPRPAGAGGQGPRDVDDRRRGVRQRRRRGGDPARRLQVVRHRVHAARDRRRARGRVGGRATARGDGRAGHLRADRVPQRRGLRWPTVRRRRRSDAEVAVRDDLQRRDGGDPGGIGRSHVPDGDPPVVGPRRRGGRGGARRTRSVSVASTPTRIRRTRGTRISPIVTGIRSGRRAPTSRCR